MQALYNDAIHSWEEVMKLLLMLGALTTAIIFVGCGTAAGRATGVDAQPNNNQTNSNQGDFPNFPMNPNPPNNSMFMPQMSSNFQEEDFKTLIEDVNEVLANQNAMKADIKDLSTNQEDIASSLANTASILDDLSNNQAISELDITPLNQSIADLSSLVSNINSQNATEGNYDEIIAFVLTELEKLDVKISSAGGNTNVITDSISITDPVDKDSKNQPDVSYGRKPDNPVTSATPLVMSKVRMEADSEYFNSCMVIASPGFKEVACSSDIYVKPGAKITWDYPTGTIVAINESSIKFVEFPDSFEPPVRTDVAQLPARMDILPSNLTFGCGEWMMDVFVEMPGKNADGGAITIDTLFSRYKVICV